MDRVLALILAGGAGERLSILCSERAKPAVPFGGKYRIIDFVLSNCANSGIANVAVLTQFNPRSLTHHIGFGRPWGLDREKGGVIVLQPFLSRSGRDWYKGTADAIYQNLYFVERERVDEVLILAGDHVYTMNYDYMIRSHRVRRADVTVGVVEVPTAEVSRFGIITLDHNDNVVSFEEKPQKAASSLASMGIYIFNRDILIDCLEENARRGGHDFGRDILPDLIGRYKVYGYRFRSYWRDVGTIEAYWKANMDLIVDLPELNLYNPEAEVRSVFENMPPVKLGPEAQVARSLITNGAIINGRVENSIISRGVFVKSGAVVENSIILEGTTVGEGTVVDRSIIDKQVWIGVDCYIGHGDDFTVNKEEPESLDSGITLIGKGAKLPNGLKVGRNCKVGCWAEKSDFPSDFIPSGESVNRKLSERY